jgi:methylthioribose-1-phosphate isomerase
VSASSNSSACFASRLFPILPRTSTRHSADDIVAGASAHDIIPAEAVDDVQASRADDDVSNGDVANKIGTYALAVLAKRHGIPFYVAAPVSTFDRSIPDGSHIPIEERPAAEVTGYRDTRWAPEGVSVRNPAFDVTPAELLTGIICEKGIAYPPYRESIAALLK